MKGYSFPNSVGKGWSFYRKINNTKSIYRHSFKNVFIELWIAKRIPWEDTKVQWNSSMTSIIWFWHMKPLANCRCNVSFLRCHLHFGQVKFFDHMCLKCFFWAKSMESLPFIISLLDCANSISAIWTLSRLRNLWNGTFGRRSLRNFIHLNPSSLHLIIFDH